MTDLYEALSQLAAGDLSESEADALHERIAQEPEVADAWETMQVTLAQLGELPDAVAPPPELDAALFAAAPTPETELTPARHPTQARGLGPSSRRWTAPALAMGLGAAIAAAALVALQPPPVELVLGPGVQEVNGAALLHVGEVDVKVDGRARIWVEPAPALPRESEAEVNMQTMNLAGAAMAGAVLTVAVYEGTAWMSDGEQVTTVESGDMHTARVPADAGAKPRVIKRRAAADSPSRSAGARDANSSARIRELEDQLEAAQFETAVAKGQLKRVEGTPMEWPADTPDVLRAEGFEAYVRDELAHIDQAELLQIDCDEYPCVAVVRSTAQDEHWQDAFDNITDGFKDEGAGEVSVMAMAAQSDDDKTGADVRLYGFAIANGSDSEAVGVRTQGRTGELLRDLSEELMGEAAGHPDEP
jgi:hypothetical protein